MVAQGVGDDQGDLLLGQLSVQLADQLVDDAPHDVAVEGVEMDNGVEAVPELGAERLLDGLAAAPLDMAALVAEADRAFAHLAGAGVRCHHEDDVTKIRLAPRVVGERRVIHYLQ
ncbi:MAG: hypothetical protein BWY66_00946 [bacterium ADurb.Bin374]|nr:MAG: hypothetical protein BWY66_00946 [bacterium ADurb.Bin374]